MSTIYVDNPNDDATCVTVTGDACGNPNDDIAADCYDDDSYDDGYNTTDCYDDTYYEPDDSYDDVTYVVYRNNEYQEISRAQLEKEQWYFESFLKDKNMTAEEYFQTKFQDMTYDGLKEVVNSRDWYDIYEIDTMLYETLLKRRYYNLAANAADNGYIVDNTVMEMAIQSNRDKVIKAMQKQFNPCN
jgi:hypothetical protein